MFFATFSSDRSALLFRRMIIFFLIILPLLASAPETAAMPSRVLSPNASLTSLLGLDDLAHNTLSKIDEVLDRTTGNLHSELEQLHTEVSDIINQLETTYKDLLNVSISSLDAEIQRLAALMVNQLNDVNDKINADIDHAQDALLTVIQGARTNMEQLTSQLEGSLRNVIVLATESVKFVLDRAAWDAIGVGSVLILLIGLLLIPVVTISAKGWPHGLGGVIAAVLAVLFIVAGAALAFSPTIKAQALKLVGKGAELQIIAPEPSISYLKPTVVILGKTSEIEIHGLHLTPGNVAPAITLDGAPASIRAFGDTVITIAVPTQIRTGTVQLMLIYSTPDKRTLGQPLVINTPTATPVPAIISISDFTLSPNGAVADNTVVTASVLLKNAGGSTSKAFTITWLLYPGGTQWTQMISPMAANSVARLNRTFTYSQAGTFQTTVQSDSTEMGSNPSVLKQQITVWMPTPTPTPTPVTSHEDFIVSEHANGSNISQQCADIDSSFTIASGWTIDRSKGDSGHQGISEIAIDDNQQSKNSLRAYNYQPTSDRRVTVTGTICSAGGWGDGAIFNRTYRVYTKKP